MISKALRPLKILIRVDGDHKIGLGHAYRMFNLAKTLNEQEHEIIFLTKNYSILKKMKTKFKIIGLKNVNQTEIKRKLKFINPNIIILDKFSEKTQTLKSYQKFAKLIAIDYTGKNKNLIKSSINILFQKSGSKNKSFNGFQYAIINPLFLKRKINRIQNKAKSILILQGGADTHCFTPKIIKALNYINADITGTVVLGPSFSCCKELKKSLRVCEKNVTILHNVNNMASIMAKHDIAITAAGMTLLQLSCLGIPSIIICGEKFENETSSLMQKMGFGINLGYGGNVSMKKIAESTQKLLSDLNKRKEMNLMGKKIVDGRGVDRIAQIINKIVN